MACFLVTLEESVTFLASGNLPECHRGKEAILPGAACVLDTDLTRTCSVTLSKLLNVSVPPLTPL